MQASRLTPVLVLIVAGAMALPGTARAGGLSTSMDSSLRQSHALPSVQHGVLAAAQTHIGGHIFGPQRADSRATRDVSAATDVMSPWSSWPAGTADEKGSAVDLSQLDTDTYNPFTLFHTVTYADSHVVGGYLQSGSVPIITAGGTGIALAYWLGTYYPTADAAVARVNDTVNTLQSEKIDGVPCRATWTACHLFAITLASTTPGTTGDAKLSAVLMIYPEGNAVGEILLISGASTLNDTTAAQSLGAAIGKIGFGADLTIRAAAGMGPAATVAIDRVKLEHLAHKSLVTTRSLKSGEQGIFVAAFHTANAGDQMPAGTVVITRSGKQLSAVTLGTVRNGNNGIVLATADSFKNTSKKTWKLVAHFNVSLAASTVTSSLTFTVKPRK